MFNMKHCTLPHMDINAAWEHGGYGSKVYLKEAFHPQINHNSFDL